MPTAQTQTTADTMQVITGFFNAWSSKDLERSMSYIADDIVVDSPNGRVEGKDAYREGLQAWFGLFTHAETIDTFAEADRGVMVYECETRVVKHVPAVEYFAIEDGKITYKRLVFDRAPFIEATQAA